MYTKQVVDSGPGSPSDLVLSSWEIAAIWVVAGEVSQFRVYSCREKTYFVYVTKPLIVFRYTSVFWGFM